MKGLYTSDRFHENFWNDLVQDWDLNHPDDFNLVFTRRPIMQSVVFGKFSGTGKV